MTMQETYEELNKAISAVTLAIGNEATFVQDDTSRSVERLDTLTKTLSRLQEIYYEGFHVRVGGS